MVSDLKQVHAYLNDLAVRASVLARVIDSISQDTRVVVAHSLGSVVAYEALASLHAGPGHSVRALVTLGSPLGIPNLIFDRLRPAPVGGRGLWPGTGELLWTNLADGGDVVALVKDLRPMFGSRVSGFLVHNGAHAHDARPYLSEKQAGAAVAAGLR
jgi:pimeloyl-ACP methyl ester carboxylesterase